MQPTGRNAKYDVKMRWDIKEYRLPRPRSKSLHRLHPARPLDHLNQTQQEHGLKRKSARNYIGDTISPNMTHERRNMNKRMKWSTKTEPPVTWLSAAPNALPGEETNGQLNADRLHISPPTDRETPEPTLPHNPSSVTNNKSSLRGQNRSQTSSLFPQRRERERKRAREGEGERERERSDGASGSVVRSNRWPAQRKKV